MAKLTRPTRSTNGQYGPQITNRPHPLPQVRAAGSLVGFTASAVVLLLLLIFILQNGQATDVHFFGAHGQLPMGVALLLAAVLGVLLVTMSATIRRIQLVRRDRRRDMPGSRPAPNAVTHPRVDAPEGRIS